jgi:hypothetical protein
MFDKWRADYHRKDYLLVYQMVKILWIFCFADNAGCKSSDLTE